MRIDCWGVHTAMYTKSDIIYSTNQHLNCNIKRVGRGLHDSAEHLLYIFAIATNREWTFVWPGCLYCARASRCTYQSAEIACGRIRLAIQIFANLLFNPSKLQTIPWHHSNASIAHVFFFSFSEDISTYIEIGNRYIPFRSRFWQSSRPLCSTLAPFKCTNAEKIAFLDYKVLAFEMNEMQFAPKFDQTENVWHFACGNMYNSMPSKLFPRSGAFGITRTREN